MENKAKKFVETNGTQEVRGDLYQLISMMYKHEENIEEEASYMLNHTQEHLDKVKMHMQTVDKSKDKDIYCELTKLRVFYERARLIQEAVERDIEKELRANGTW